MRVAALADVHGNAPALEAVLAEVEREQPDLIVFGGDLTWGPLPEETLALLEPLRDRARFVRGNSEEYVLSWLHGEPTEHERGPWMAERHAAAQAFLEAYEEAVVVDVDGLGPTRFVHGSPRNVEEIVTERTPAERAREFMAGVGERVVVTAHVHVQYDRMVDGVRLLSPGSVGLPYEGRRSLAFWAVLGPDVDLRSTPYDLDAALVRLRATTVPSFADREEQLLLEPPSRDEAIEHGESLVFAG